MTDRLPGDRVPDLLVERLAADELPDDLKREIRQRLQREPGGLERLQRIAQGNAEALSAYPPARIVAEIRRRNAGRHMRVTRRQWAVGAALAAAAAAVLLVVGPVLQPPPSDPATPGAAGVEATRTKGRPRLLVYRLRDDRAQLLQHGARVRAGDLLQLAYQANGAEHGVIFSVDGRGELTLHYPAKEDGSTALAGGQARQLPHAFELDDAPNFERLFFVTAGRAIDVEALLAAGRALGTDPASELALPAGLELTEVLLRKGQR